MRAGPMTIWTEMGVGGGARSESEISSEGESDRDGSSDFEVDANREEAHSGRHKAPLNKETAKPSASCNQSQRAETGKMASSQKKPYSNYVKEYKAGGNGDLLIVQ